MDKRTGWTGFHTLASIREEEEKEYRERSRETGPGRPYSHGPDDVEGNKPEITISNGIEPDWTGVPHGQENYETRERLKYHFLVDLSMMLRRLHDKGFHKQELSQILLAASRELDPADTY